MRLIVFLLLATTTLSGCGTFGSDFVDSNKAEGDVVVLTDYELNDGYIVIKTVSNGCTFFNSFQVAVKDQQRNSLQVLRTQPDECKMQPRTVSLQFSIKHLGLDFKQPIKVANPLEATN